MDATAGGVDAIRGLRKGGNWAGLEAGVRPSLQDGAGLWANRYPGFHPGLFSWAPYGSVLRWDGTWGGG